MRVLSFGKIVRDYYPDLTTRYPGMPSICYRARGSRGHSPQSGPSIKFLIDQDVYASIVRFLRDLGRDVLPLAQIGLSQTSDEELLRIAQEQNRIFVIRDRDFGL